MTVDALDVIALVALPVIGVAALVVLALALRHADDGAGRWQVRCTRCQRVRSAEEVGVVRWGAHSKWKRTLGRCSACGGLRWLAIERTTASRSAGGAA